MPRITKPQIIMERLNKVRQIMENKGIDLYIIGTGDYHMSEYAGDYFAEREYMSGFTGSAGTLVITKDTAALFTDGRYFGQAQQQIDKTGINLMKMGTAGTPELNEYCIQMLPEKGVIGFDGRTVGAMEGLELQKAAKKCNGTVDYRFNAVDEVWDERPGFPGSKAYELEEKYAGTTRTNKLNMIRDYMESEHADVHVIASLDDICWILNIRGNDVECNPVVMAYALITQEIVYLYAQEEKFDIDLKKSLEKDGVVIKPYNDVYNDVALIGNESEKNFNGVLAEKKTLLFDLKRINMQMYCCVFHNVCKIEKENPSVLFKAKKNDTEINNLKSVHIDDGLAVTKFMFWLKKNMKNYNLHNNITEVTAAEYLDNLRSGIEDFIELSFPTISAYNENAAMMHYAASKDNCAVLKPEGILLVDSGGQYYRGTTDITRTFALGKTTEQLKKHFTLTLKGMLNLTYAHFLKGCTGFNLDILARQPLWNEGIDYRCGTGHGIGYLLNVHESPNGFRWKHNPGYNDLCVLEEGMVTSNEPGVYIDGEYGIRIENEIVCIKDYENEYGTFMKFETLTYVPIDLDLVDVRYLTQQDIDRLNEYHGKVYEKLSPFMEGEDLEYLKKYTRAIDKSCE